MSFWGFRVLRCIFFVMLSIFMSIQPLNMLFVYRKRKCISNGHCRFGLWGLCHVVMGLAFLGCMSRRFGVLGFVRLIVLLCINVVYNISCVVLHDVHVVLHVIHVMLLCVNAISWFFFGVFSWSDDISLHIHLLCVELMLIWCNT